MPTGNSPGRHPSVLFGVDVSSLAGTPPDDERGDDSCGRGSEGSVERPFAERRSDLDLLAGGPLVLDRHLSTPLRSTHMSDPMSWGASRSCCQFLVRHEHSSAVRAAREAVAVLGATRRAPQRLHRPIRHRTVHAGRLARTVRRSLIGALGRSGVIRVLPMCRRSDRRSWRRRARRCRRARPDRVASPHQDNRDRCVAHLRRRGGGSPTRTDPR